MVNYHYNVNTIFQAFTRQLFSNNKFVSIFRAEDYALCTALDPYFGCFAITWEHGEVALSPSFMRVRMSC